MHDDDKWQVDPKFANTESDPDRKQVLAVVQHLPLPCDDGDVAAVISNLDQMAIRRALTELGTDRLQIETDGSPEHGRVVVTAVLNPED